MEDKVIRPFYHKHPLILKENVSKKKGVDCYGCGNLVTNLEMAYVCIENNCRSSIILHKKCGELPSEIRHPKHPDHPLHLFDYHMLNNHFCDICLSDLYNVLGYRCSGCDFEVDITCEKISIDMLLEERKELQHPSHPDHPLTLMRKPAFEFRCDGCGEQDVDMAYICSTCEFWVHRRCAELPLRRECRHHHHHLSLAFSFPKKHLEYAYKCEVCDGYFDRTCWVYFCGNCRYFVHIKCVDQSTTTPNSIDINEEDGVIQFPLDAKDMSNKLITPFVMREKGLGLDNIPTPTSNVFLSNYHAHPLSLVLEETNSEEEGKEEEEEEKEELIKICDVCVTPISSSSSPYYHCPISSCNYFIHSICSMLPNTLQYSSSPNLVQLYGDCQKIPNKNHNFTLYKSRDKHGISCWACNLCRVPTNGMGYTCGECGMKIDIKCASLPTTIRHSSHLRRHHEPLVLTRKVPPQGKDKGRSINKCRACYNDLHNAAAYCCSVDGCDFGLDFKCLLLPMSVTDREWDNKHPLLLTFDASLDHPSDFFCDVCETQMFPKQWMYHCRRCDISFHLYCLRNASGWHRNIKFGRRFELNGIHPNHPLTFSYITLKRSCDRCKRNVYMFRGFECADCYYVVCENCGFAELKKI